MQWEGEGPDALKRRLLPEERQGQALRRSGAGRRRHGEHRRAFGGGPAVGQQRTAVKGRPRHKGRPNELVIVSLLNTETCALHF